MTSQDALMVIVLPKGSRYAVDDPRRRQEAAELADELRRVVTVVPVTPDPDSKGAVETATAITLMLGSLNAIRYAVAAFRIWTERDARRDAEIHIGGPKGQSVQIRLKGFDQEALIRALEAVRDGRTPD
jgi:hypothetical protein